MPYVVMCISDANFRLNVSIYSCYCFKMVGRHTGHCTVRQNGHYLNASDITVATVLGSAGYHTALIGKWGLGQPTEYLLRTLHYFLCRNKWYRRFTQ